MGKNNFSSRSALINNYFLTDYMLGTIEYHLLFINTFYLHKLDASRKNFHFLLNSQNNDTTISLLFLNVLLINPCLSPLAFVSLLLTTAIAGKQMQGRAMVGTVPFFLNLCRPFFVTTFAVLFYNLCPPCYCLAAIDAGNRKSCPFFDKKKGEGKGKGEKERVKKRNSCGQKAG